MGGLARESSQLSSPLLARLRHRNVVTQTPSPGVAPTASWANLQNKVRDCAELYGRSMGGVKMSGSTWAVLKSARRVTCTTVANHQFAKTGTATSNLRSRDLSHATRDLCTSTA